MPYREVFLNDFNETDNTLTWTGLAGVWMEAAVYTERYAIRPDDLKIQIN